MPVMNFDLEDGLDPVSFTLKHEDAERFAAFMQHCFDLEQVQNTHISELEEQIEGLTARAERLRCLGNLLVKCMNGEGSMDHTFNAIETWEAAEQETPDSSLARLKDDIRTEVWNEINGPVSASGEPVIPAPPPLDDRALRLCYAIEQAGASETLTEASVLASELHNVLLRHCAEQAA